MKVVDNTAGITAYVTFVFGALFLPDVRFSLHVRCYGNHLFPT